MTGVFFFDRRPPDRAGTTVGGEVDPDRTCGAVASDRRRHGQSRRAAVRGVNAAGTASGGHPGSDRHRRPALGVLRTIAGCGWRRARQAVPAAPRRWSGDIPARSCGDAHGGVLDVDPPGAPARRRRGDRHGSARPGHRGANLVVYVLLGDPVVGRHVPDRVHRHRRQRSCSRAEPAEDPTALPRRLEHRPAPAEQLRDRPAAYALANAGGAPERSGPCRRPAHGRRARGEWSAWSSERPFGISAHYDRRSDPVKDRLPTGSRWPR